MENHKKTNFPIESKNCKANGISVLSCDNITTNAIPFLSKRAVCNLAIDTESGNSGLHSQGITNLPEKIKMVRNTMYSIFPIM